MLGQWEFVKGWACHGGPQASARSGSNGPLAQCFSSGVSSPASQEHLATSRDTFGCHTWVVLLASNGWGPEILLSPLQ